MRSAQENVSYSPVTDAEMHAVSLKTYMCAPGVLIQNIKSGGCTKQPPLILVDQS